MSTLIYCDKVSKSFGHHQALNNISFELATGETTALVGPNGAGKTTLFSLLCHYLHPTSGTIKILGHAPGSQQLYGQISALPQDAQLDPAFTIQQQLQLFAKLQHFSNKEAQRECQRVLETVDLLHVLKERPQALSHGMLKRVCIAQALIGKPSLIMLDEPTAGLDPSNAKNIRQLITDLSDDVNVIISSHNLDELERLCSSVLYLEQGKLTQHTVGYSGNNQLKSVTLLLDPTSLNTREVLSNIQGISKCNQINKNEFILYYHETDINDFDITLIKNLQQHGLQYRQITKGVSLEQQLFN